MVHTSHAKYHFAALVNTICMRRVDKGEIYQEDTENADDAACLLNVKGSHFKLFPYCTNVYPPHTSLIFCFFFFCLHELSTKEYINCS